MRVTDVCAAGTRILAAVTLLASGSGCSGSDLASEPSLARDVNAAVIFLARTEEPSAYMSALLLFRLTLDPQGCLRAGPDRHTLVWPTGYSVSSTGGGVHILDPDGRIVATVGQALRVGGGEMTSLEHVPLDPADAQRATAACPGRFWIVSGP